MKMLKWQWQSWYNKMRRVIHIVRWQRISYKSKSITLITTKLISLHETVSTEATQFI